MELVNIAQNVLALTNTKMIYLISNAKLFFLKKKNNGGTSYGIIR